jgi:dephospho-CoA kinase
MTNARAKPVIGLLGGIGAGKSTVAAELVSLGCGLVDADAIGHELLEEADVRSQLREILPEDVFDPDGRVDRRAAAHAVFASRGELDKLNAVMHPRIRRRMERRIDELRADPHVAAIVIDAALLLETDWHDLCTHFVFVSAPGRARAERVRAARGWSTATWKARENSQKPLDIKASKAEYVVDNSSSVSRLREQVCSVFHRIVGPADLPMG